MNLNLNKLAEMAATAGTFRGVFNLIKNNRWLRRWLVVLLVLVVIIRLFFPDYYKKIKDKVASTTGAA